MTTPVSERNWLGRNWKWFVPLLGCMGLTFLIGLVALVVALVVGAMRSSDVYNGAVARAKLDPSVVLALGTPIGEGWFVTGNIQMSGSSGHADFSIPIHGPKGAATIYAIATKSAGQWKFTTLVVEVSQTRARLDLLQVKTETPHVPSPMPVETPPP